MPLELDSSLDPPKTPVRLAALGMAESESPANALFDPRCRPSTPGMFTPPERSFEPPADDRLLVSALTESTPMTCKTKFCVHVKMTTSVTAMYTPRQRRLSGQNFIPKVPTARDFRLFARRRPFVSSLHLPVHHHEHLRLHTVSIDDFGPRDRRVDRAGPIIRSAPPNSRAQTV